MEPLKPEQKQRILKSRPNVAKADIDEYQRLLAERFATDPNVPATNARLAAAAPAPSLTQCDSAKREARLLQLHEKLFGNNPRA